MIQKNYFSENPDLQEQFEGIIDWEEIVKAYEGDEFIDAKTYAETNDESLAYAPNNVEEALEYYRSTLDVIGELSGKEIAAVAQEIDHIGLKLENGKVQFPEAMKKAYFTYKEAGLQPSALSRKYGGVGIPATVVAMGSEMMSRADASMSIAIGATNIGECLEHFASEEVKKEYVGKLASGEYTCAMALTEPNYGSDLQSLQTKAVQDEDGTWKLTGTKRFITHGCGFDDVPALILTLARTGNKDSGGRGLSFFIVDSNDIEVAGIEHKMGLHCSATCEIVYDNSKGVLIGEVGEGLIKGAMGMMNSARLAVGSQSLGIAQAALGEMQKYAGERVQFGKLIQELPAVKKMLDHAERDVAVMRCLAFEAARSVDLYTWRKARLHNEGKSDREIRKDATVKKWDKIAGVLTPLNKYYNSEGCVKVAYDAQQVHGGAGYTEEYDVARIYRDARITTIYEGTTQLQTIAIIGGFTAGMGANGYFREFLNEELAKFSASAELVKIGKEFDEIITLFKGLSDKDTLAFEVVESGARYVGALLMERAASRQSGEAKENRLRLTRAYNAESVGIIAKNKIAIELALKEPALV